jgi:hypothetical protein
MSHIVRNTTEGRIISIEALRLGCDSLTIAGKTKLLQLDKTEPGQGRYRTWGTDHEGSGEVGDGADYVIRATIAGRDYLRSRGYQKPYEVGVIWSEKDQCYHLAHDSFNSGNGIEYLVGKTEVGETDASVTSCPEIIKWYNASRDKLAAEQNGDRQIMSLQADGSVLVGAAGDLLVLSDGSEIPLGVGDMVAEIEVGGRIDIGGGLS